VALPELVGEGLAGGAVPGVRPIGRAVKERDTGVGSRKPELVDSAALVSCWDCDCACCSSDVAMADAGDVPAAAPGMLAEVAGSGSGRAGVLVPPQSKPAMPKEPVCEAATTICTWSSWNEKPPPEKRQARAMINK
jgi:hypothetical protein